jgi:hypothetical protein
VRAAGAWKKITAAIKVFYPRASEREAMKDAVEMAVLTTVQHPCIVGMYSCLTDCIEMAGGFLLGSAGVACGQRAACFLDYAAAITSHHCH